jgi:hypothetical protein
MSCLPLFPDLKEPTRAVLSALSLEPCRTRRQANSDHRINGGLSCYVRAAQRGRHVFTPDEQSSEEQAVSTQQSARSPRGHRATDLSRQTAAGALEEECAHTSIRPMPPVTSQVGM